MQESLMLHAGLLALLSLAWSGDKRAVRFEDLPTPLLTGVNDAASFERLRSKLEAEAAERMRAGDREHLIYYVLQGTRFTKEPSIEPALSAKQFVEAGGESMGVPADVQRRIRDFLASGPEGDERLRYFRPIAGRTEELRADYQSAMRFLYEKEFTSKRAQGDSRREFVASLYQTRGLSTDSRPEANFPVYLALRSLAGERIQKVLIVGPGMDLAPRTQLDDSVPPRSLQPYAVADALLQLGLATREKLRIHCVDLNPRVVEFLRRPQARTTIAAKAGTRELQQYLRDFGRANPWSSEIASRMTAQKLNIVTERYDPSPGYDLAIATNVFVYFSREELALAMANIHSMLRDGGYLVHNESRAEMESFGSALGLPVIDAKMVRLFEDDRRAIFDMQVIHQRRS